MSSIAEDILGYRGPRANGGPLCVVAVLVESGGAGPRRMASLHAGDFFGEMALLSAAPRNATVQAVTACQLYELAKRDVDALCEVCTGVRNALTEAARQRKAATEAAGPTRPSSAFTT